MLRIFPKIGYAQWVSVWLPRIKRVHHVAEYISVKNGLRKATIYHIDYTAVDEELEKIRKDGLVFVPIRKVGHYFGFSHFHPPYKEGSPFFWYGALARDEKIAEQLKAADLKVDHYTVGKLLGYPECCVRYVVKYFPKNYDPIWIGLRGKVTGYPENNQLLRYFGVRITSHLSCSPKCKETKALGEKWFSLMLQEDREAAQKLYELLSSPITWNSYHGVVEVETPYFIGVANTYPYLTKPRIIVWRSIK